MVHAPRSPQAPTWLGKGAESDTEKSVVIGDSGAARTIFLPCEKAKMLEAWAFKK